MGDKKLKDRIRLSAFVRSQGSFKDKIPFETVWACAVESQRPIRAMVWSID